MVTDKKAMQELESICFQSGRGAIVLAGSLSASFSLVVFGFAAAVAAQVTPTGSRYGIYLENVRIQSSLSEYIWVPGKPL